MSQRTPKSPSPSPGTQTQSKRNGNVVPADRKPETVPAGIEGLVKRSRIFGLES